jgi:hypothetical protein
MNEQWATPVSTDGRTEHPKPPEAKSLTNQWGPWSIMSCLHGFEEQGDWQGAKWLLRWEGASLDALGDPDVDSELGMFRRRLRDALDYERLHGEGALLRRDHPNVIRREAAIEAAFARASARPGVAEHLKMFADLWPPELCDPNRVEW